MSDALAVLAGLVLEKGQRWGDAAAEFQWADARAVLDVDGPRRHFLTRPRGGSKTSDLGGIAVAALLEQLPRQSRSYAYAADRDQSALLLDAVLGFLDRTPGLGGALKVDQYRLTNPRTGATLQVEASDDASAWGTLPHLTIVDEFAQWPSTSKPKRLWSAIFTALPKVATSRLAILTSAGDPAHWSYGVLQRAKASPRWRVNETPGPVPWLDADDLAEQKAALPEWEYARLHLNEWQASDDRLTTVDDLAACVRLDGPRDPAGGRVYGMGLDLGLKNDRTVVGVCSLDDAELGTVTLDRMGVWAGSRAAPVELGAVEAWVYQAWLDYGRPLLVADPYQAAQLLQRLRARGVQTVEYAFTQASVSRLALRLHQLIGDHALALPDDEQLIDELANVRLREPSPGVYRLDHDPDRHDDRAIALALACHGLLDAEVVESTTTFELDDADLDFSLDGGMGWGPTW